jgi:hypothetical protein
MFNYNNNSNTNQSQNNNITGYIPYADNFPTNFFQPNKISIINNSDINNTSQFNSFNNNQSLSNQNNFNPYNNNKINIFNNNNINSPKIETVNKNEETDADLIQGLSGKYIHNKDNSEDNIKSKEILINLGKIVVNDQVLNNFPIINLTNLNKYDIPLTEKMLNNDDFFTAIKENKDDENQMPIEEEDEKKEIIADNFILDIDENIFNNLKEFMSYEERKRYINYKQLMLRKLIEKLYNKSVDIILEIKRNIKNKVKKSKNFELSNSLSNVFKLHNELYNKYLISQNKQPINENKEYYTYIQYFIDNSNGKTYKCEICSKEFINFHKLGGHMSKVHPNCSEKYKKQNDTRKQREGNRKVLDYVKEKLFEKYNLNYRKMKQNDEKDKIKIFIKAHQKEYEILRRKIHREKALKNNEEED